MVEPGSPTMHLLKSNNSPTMQIQQSFSFKDEKQDFGFPTNPFGHSSVRSQYLIETDEAFDLI